MFKEFLSNLLIAGGWVALIFIPIGDSTERLALMSILLGLQMSIDNGKR